MGLRRGAWWELDELAVNQSILRGRRGRLRLGTWGGERLRKGGLPARIEALLAVWGQAARGGEWRMPIFGPLGVKEPAFLGVGKKGPVLMCRPLLPQERSRHGAALNIKTFLVPPYHTTD